MSGWDRRPADRRASVVAAVRRLLVPFLVAVAPARAAAQSCDARTPELRTVRFQGNASFSDRTLGHAVASQPTAWVRRVFRVVGTRRCLDPEEVPRDVARLLLHYRRHGYPRAEVTTAIDRRPAKGARLTFTIREGEPIRIDSLAIVGEPPGTPVDSGPRLPAALDAVRAGHTLSVSALDSAALTVRRRLQARGYYSASVTHEARVDSAALTARVVLRAAPGPPVHVGEVRVEVAPFPGKAQRVSDAGLRRMTGLAPGSLLRTRDLETARRNLLTSEVYRQAAVRVDSVRVDSVRVGAAREGDDGRAPTDGRAYADVTIAAAETHPNDAELRVAWATLDCLRAQLTLHRTAVVRPTGQLTVTSRVSKVGVGSPLDFAPWLCSPAARDDPFSAYLNYYLGLTFTNPGLGVRPVRRSVSIFTERRSEYLAYLRTSYIGGSLSASRPLRARRWVGTLGYQMTYGRTVAEPAVLCGVFSACLPEDREALAEARRLGVISAAVVRDGTDLGTNPTRGTVLRGELRGSSRYLFSDPRWAFVGLRLDASYYRPLGRDVTGAVRVRVAGVRPIGSGDAADVPIEERLYAGGATTVRGFQQNELGPQVYLPESFTTVVEQGDTLFRSDPKSVVATTTPSGGNDLVVGSVEVRVRPPVLSTLLQLVAFVDAGALWNQETTGGREAAKLRVTPGVGLRLFTPVGVARLDVGYSHYAPEPGPAYYDVAPGYAASAPLYCVSPDNRLPVTGVGLVDPEGNPIPPTQAQGTCPATFAPERPRSFFNRLTLHFSFGQAF